MNFFSFMLFSDGNPHQLPN